MLNDVSEKKILLNVCCGPDATIAVKQLKEENWHLVAHWTGLNIHPEDEHNLRLNETIKLSKEMDFALIIENYNPDFWFKFIEGFEDEPEGGKRCELCMKVRLELSGREALNRNIKYFATTLTTSPHKNYELICDIGKTIADKYNLIFLPYNFKKKNGFLKSIELSRKFNLYRQDYCGCKFSLRNKG